jgi:wyosine [tRNA(Phe)-imidazoG37] synthetase (radical SAM superfamily)
MYVYGPVPSRRLGYSLGVSPIPAKTCSYTCVYCQLGRTTTLEINRKSYYPRRDILDEIISLAHSSNPEIVTFAGDGEPTLCKDLGWLINQAKSSLDLPVAVITNGSLLHLPDVRRDLSEADLVLPTLDAGGQAVFKKINRPHRDIDFDTMLNGLIDFRKDYRGKIWLEIMLVKGVNDSKSELLKIKQAADRFRPDRIYVVVPIRPPAEDWVEPPDAEMILKAQRIFQKSIPLSEREAGEFGLEGFTDAKRAIIEIGSRHPLRKAQAIEIEKRLGMSGTVEGMILAGELEEKEYEGETYLLPAHFKRKK